MPLIKINDTEIEVPKGKRILDAATENGIHIPFYCYHPGMKVVASCRMCLVEMVGMPKPMPACSTEVMELPEAKKIEDKYDAVIRTDSEIAHTAQRSVLEFLLLNHPLDCPICDKAGECKLQDYSFDYGNDHSRFVETKRIPEKKDLGPTIELYTSRCIMCTRCVRFTQEVTQTEELKVTERGWHEEISVLPNHPLDNKMMGNVVDLCPVGCLIDKREKFEGRVWNFHQTDSICPGCSKGCNTHVDVMKPEKLNLEELIDKVYRVRPRENMDVNQWWICDIGRYYLEEKKSLKRVLVPRVMTDGDQHDTNWDDAFAAIKKIFESYKPSEITFVGSPYASNEENFIFRQLAKMVSANVDTVDPIMDESHTYNPQHGPEFTIEAERAPNVSGAKAIFQISKSKLKSTLKSAKVVVLLNSDNVSISEKPEKLIVLGAYDDEAAAKADVHLPVTIFTETDGTFTNKDGLVQRFNQGVVPFGEIRQTWKAVADLASCLDQSATYDSIELLAESMFESADFGKVDVEKLYPVAKEEMIL